MRFPYQATFRLVPEGHTQGVTLPPIYTTPYTYPCFASATSGTFDPDIQFDGESLTTGIFGQFVDVWISNKDRDELTNIINTAIPIGMPFRADRSFRLIDVTRPMKGDVKKSISLFDPRAVTTQATVGGLLSGFDLAATRVFPIYTAYTFTIKRFGI